MHRRLAIAFSIVCTAAALAACGDAGDHLGEFRQNTPTITASKITAVMPIVAGPNTKSGTFKLYVTAYGPNGQAVSVGAALTNPIVIQSNDTYAVTFGSSNKTSLQFTGQPGPITVHYVAPRHPCNPPIGITAFNHDATPQVVDVDVVACASPSPTPTSSTSPSSSPTTSPSTSPSASPSSSPTPAGGTVARLALSLQSTPNPLSGGTFTMVLTAFNGSGKAIPTGTVLTNPINLTSNASCNIGFVENGATSPSLQLDAAPGFVTIEYTPTTGCTQLSKITISAFDLNAKPQTATVSISGGTATVTGLALSTINTPDPTSVGTYPLFVTASDAKGVIPYGVSLNNPIELSSNSSCAVTFGVTLNPTTYTTTYRLTSTQTQVYMQFNNTNCTPPSTGIVTVQAITVGTPRVQAQYQFPW